MKHRILVISREYEPMVAGVSKYISEIVRRANVEKTVIVLRFGARTDKSVIEVEYPKFAKDRISKTVYFVIASVLKSLSQRYDVVIGNAFIGGLVGSIIKLIRGKPLVSVVYDVDFINVPSSGLDKISKYVRKYVTGFSVGLSDRIIVDSEKVKREIVKFYGTNPDKIVSISAGINKPKRFSKITRKNKKLVLFVGNMAEKKGLTDLVNAMRYVTNTFSDAELWFVGPDKGPFEAYSKKLRRTVIKLGLGKNIKFLGLVKRVEPYYQACYVLVLPSHHSEGFGLPIIEAAYFGKPSIATEIFKETGVITDKTGLIVPEKDPKKLSRAIIKMLKNTMLRNSMGRNARIFVKRFDWKKSAKKFEEVVNDAINTKNA